MCGQTLLKEANRHPGGTERGLKATLTGMALGILAAYQLDAHSDRLRFFQYTSRREDYLVPHHPMLCLNGIASDPLQDLPATTHIEDVIRLARKVSSRKRGLVFQYGEAACSVLFCGDSRMNFLGRHETIDLDRPTIVTAPRQGATSGDAAYRHITSSKAGDDIWVRGHNPSVSKVSSFYQNLPDKTCLWNCHHNTMQEIVIRYDRGNWRTLSGGACPCRQSPLKEPKKETHISDMRFWLP